MLYVIGKAPASELYNTGDWAQFLTWAAQQTEFELDIETDVTPYWCTKKLITVQLGQVGGGDQWVMQWSALTDAQKSELKTVLESPTTKLAHNATFEYVVLRFHGIILSKLYDTMVIEQVVTGGVETENYSLADLCAKYLYKILDKSEQKNFGDDILTESKVIYAANDVMDLGKIRERQLETIKHWSLERVVELENEALLSFADITYNGMTLDQAKWQANEQLAHPVVEESLKRLNSWLTHETFREAALEYGYMSTKDRTMWNLNAPQQKKELLQLLFPDILGASQGVLKTYVRDNGPNMSAELLAILVGLQGKDVEPLSEYLLKHHRDTLIRKGYLVPAGEATINWNSADQVLPLFKEFAPKLKSLAEDALAKYGHKIIDDLHEYKDALKLINTYGQTFIEKHVEPDGKVRTQFNQVVSTGRVSSRKPNMQNIPAKESIGTRYRNAFVCESDFVFVDSDFSSQELAIIAHISKDPVWNEALEQGQDLHSVCAEQVYKEKWLSAKSDDCAYYKVTPEGIMAREKCSCKQHKSLRTAVKTVNFGLAYGMGSMKLAGTINCTVAEADALIAQYFKVFPKIGGVLKFLGEFGVKNGYIQTISPFFRKRWFPFWKFAKGRISGHLSGAAYDGTLGEIERASKNQPEHCYGLAKSGELRELYNSEVKRILSQAA